jgi:hypothetical protein
MEVICLEDAAFYVLIDKVVERIKEQNNIREDKWISGQEAMQKLRISSKTTLQNPAVRGIPQGDFGLVNVAAGSVIRDQRNRESSARTFA